MRDVLQELFSLLFRHHTKEKRHLEWIWVGAGKEGLTCVETRGAWSNRYLHEHTYEFLKCYGEILRPVILHPILVLL